MTFKHLLYTIFFLINLFALKNQELTACAYIPEPNRNSITFFNPDIVTDTTYRACYVDAGYYMPDEYASSEMRYRYNLLEWQQYFNSTKPPGLQQVAEVIYDISAEALQKDALNPILQGSKPGKLIESNALLRLLYNRKDAETLTYLIYAKQCEPFVQHIWDYWDDPGRDTLKMQRLIEEGVRHYAAVKPAYLKLRYAFQIVRLAHYSEKYSDCTLYYDRLVTPLLQPDNSFINKSVVLGWTMALKAGALLRTNKPAEAMYLFSAVFNNFADSRKIAIQNFNYGNETLWQQMLQFTKTPAEKAALWALRSMQDNALDIAPLEQIYALAPESTLAEVMLIREINKTERFLLTPFLTDTIVVETNAAKPDVEVNQKNIKEKGIWHKIKSFFAKIWNSIKKLFNWSEAKKENRTVGGLSNHLYIENLKIISEKAAAGKKVRNADLWYTAAAYLAYLQQNYRQCYGFLNHVSGADKKVQAQANLIYALARVDEAGTLTAETEGLFAEALKNLPRPQYEYNNYGIFSRVLARLAQNYLKNGNVPRAFLCLDKAMETSAANALLDFYASEKDLNELQNLLNTPRKTGFDTLLLNNSRCTPAFVADVLGTKLMRKLQYAEALQEFEKIPNDYWLKDSLHYFANANYIYFTCNFNGLGVSDSCNKTGFARKVVELQEAAKQNPQTADVYYRQLADGFFATPYWGYNGALWHGSLVASLNYYYDYMPGAYPLNLPKFAKNLYEAQQLFLEEYGTRKVAIAYYQKVIETTKDPELAASSAYMALLAQQEPLSSLHEGNYKDRKFQKLLKEKYSGTDFYHAMVQTCPGIGEY
ncbi:hypothetical protein C7N43_04195 [Sphingobacteriales bacterium UPWRP_1]|nr:hypothetical protein B6N25_04740 [Sphingobacteriales bacterium TSM_CSS]PSJ78268.1 hypothetical protein C7N43_04195 [Sphingobacteriales bacterium UPWRP_1]